MRTIRKFSHWINIGALLMFLAAVVALLLSQRKLPAQASNRQPASMGAPSVSR
ncbi:MAG TPA: hypothetical protein VIH99_03040 [Bdellovibrionota bacterium]